MKYKVGDRTLLGEITDHYQKINGDWVYYIGGRLDGSWFTESEIDAIIIKPKRNIDHLIELIEARKREEAVAFIDYDHSRNAPWANLNALLYPYIEPRKYPVLSSEELKAVKWLVDGGYTEIRKDPLDVSVYCRGFKAWLIHSPIAECLCNAKWITTEPINLAELLAAQEEK